MIKTHTLNCVILTLGIMIVVTTPAFAEFASNNGAPKGTSTITSTGVFSFNGIVFHCRAEGVTTAWTILTSGKVGEQAPTTKGPDQRFAIKWQTTAGDKKCMSTIGASEFSFTAGPCNIQLEQIAGKLTEVHGSIESECEIKIIGCDIKMPAAKGTKNKGLKSLNVANKGKNLGLTNTNLEGITYTSTGVGCTALGEFANGKISGLEAEMIGETLV